MLQAIRSEFIKLRYLPLYWLIGFICFCIWAILITAHIADVNGAVTLSGSPWDKTMYACNGMLAVFMGSPFIILFIGAALYIEHQSQGWKQLYALPKTRISLLLSKLAAILISILLSFMLIIPGFLLSGYLLNGIFPEYEFTYYTPPFLEITTTIFKIFIALLGIIGIQFFMSTRFKGFLIPASVGVISFIVGLILATTNKSMALYFPYSYPMIARDRGMFRTDKIGIVDHGFLTNVEIYSIIVFLVFVALTLLTERKRNIS